jgi:hypothetical protein
MLGAIVVLAFLTLLFPYATAALDDPPDASQNKCSKQGHPDDPLAIDRPAYAGQVRKIRLTDSGEFVDRCELTDVLYDLPVIFHEQAARAWLRHHQRYAVSLSKPVAHCHGRPRVT